MIYKALTHLSQSNKSKVVVKRIFKAVGENVNMDYFLIFETKHIFDF